MVILTTEGASSSMFGTDIGIDLGTANILVCVKGKGLVICEPSVIAMNLDTSKIVAIGEEARKMIGRTPGNIKAIRPLKDGVIADYEITASILKYSIHKVCGKPLFSKPRVVVCVPSGGTDVEKRAVLEAVAQAAAKEVYLISEPMAAAIGCGLDISAPSGNMVIDIGGGTTDVAVISLNGEVVSESIRIGGDHFEDAIIRYIKRTYNIAIGESTAEEIKIEIGTVYPKPTMRMTVRGLDLVSGLPSNIEISALDVYKAFEEPVKSIIQLIKDVLEITPPELAADIIRKGMMLTGGGALLRGFDMLIEEETGVPVQVPNDPLTCVARGTEEVLKNLNKIKNTSILLSRKF